MNKGIKQIVTSILLCILLIIASFTFAFAANGDGTGGGNGNGSGENSDIALTLESSSVKNGDTNIPLNPIVDLLFNKNVVNISIYDNNSKCFHLISSSGESVSIKIIFPDDQVRREFREHIFIAPEQNLEPNSKYTLYIDSTLKAKNTTTIDNAYNISFTTGTEITAETNASLSDLADDVIVFTKETPTNANSNKESTTAVKTADKKVDANNLSKIIIIVVAVIAVIFTVLIILIKRKDKNNKSNSESNQS